MAAKKTPPVAPISLAGKVIKAGIVFGKATYRQPSKYPTPKFSKYTGPPIDIDAVVNGKRNKKLAKRYPKNNIPKSKV